MSDSGDIDWSIRRAGGGWSIFKNGVACDGSGAPASLKGIHIELGARAGSGVVPDLPCVAVVRAVPGYQGFCPVTGRKIEVNAYSEVRNDGEGADPAAEGDDDGW